MSRAFVAALALAATLAGPAGAQELMTRWFAGGDRCYARDYDAAHLRSHPGQVVTRIWVGGRAGDARSSSRELNVGFTANGREYRGVGVCRERFLLLACGVEGDGGAFRIRPSDGGAMRFTVDDRMALEGGEDFSPELGGPEDREFRLPRAPARACR